MNLVIPSIKDGDQCLNRVANDVLYGKYTSRTLVAAPLTIALAHSSGEAMGTTFSVKLKPIFLRLFTAFSVPAI